MNNDRYIEKTFLNSSELIDRSTKTRTVNTIKEKLKDLQGSTKDTYLLNIIGSLDKLLDDAYIVDMYKFQFKIFTTTIQKEINQIEKIINA